MKLSTHQDLKIASNYVPDTMPFGSEYKGTLPPWTAIKVTMFPCLLLCGSSQESFTHPLGHHAADRPGHIKSDQEWCVAQCNPWWHVSAGFSVPFALGLVLSAGREKHLCTLCGLNKLLPGVTGNVVGCVLLVGEQGHSRGWRE